MRNIFKETLLDKMPSEYIYVLNAGELRQKSERTGL